MARCTLKLFSVATYWPEGKETISDGFPCSFFESNETPVIVGLDCISQFTLKSWSVGVSRREASFPDGVYDSALYL